MIFLNLFISFHFQNSRQTYSGCERGGGGGGEVGHIAAGIMLSAGCLPLTLFCFMFEVKS